MRDVGDIIDQANDYTQDMLEMLIATQRKDIEPGVPGECDLCGEDSLRLIRGACAPCRDRYSLP